MLQCELFEPLFVRILDFLCLIFCIYLKFSLLSISYFEVDMKSALRGNNSASFFYLLMCTLTLAPKAMVVDTPHIATGHVKGGYGKVKQTTCRECICMVKLEDLSL